MKGADLSVSLRQTTLLSPAAEREIAPPDPLAHLMPGTRAKVLLLARVRDYEKGGMLFRQGDVHDGIFLVESGLIKSYYESEDGRELTLGFWTAGHYVGAPQMFGGGQHAWTSVAVAPTRCLWIPGPPLRELCREHGDLALALIDALVHKTQCYCGVLQLLATHSMRVRLARLLAMFASREPAGSAVVGFSHGELASMIGSTRQWVSRSLARFEDEGLLDRLPDGTYLVRDEELLRRVH